MTIPPNIGTIGFLIFILSLSYSLQLAAQQDEGQFNEILRRKVENICLLNNYIIDDEKITCSASLSEFYRAKKFTRAWTNEDAVKEFIDLISQAHLEGLNAKDYHYGKILQYQNDRFSMMDEVNLEILLSDAFLLYTSHMLNGKVNPESIFPEWNVVRKEGNPLALLVQFLLNPDKKWLLNAITPQNRYYHALKQALSDYRLIASRDGWQWVPDRKVLKKDSHGKTVMILKEKLRMMGDYDTQLTLDTLFDENLENAVKSFQKRHGLDVDGIVGKESFMELNRSAEERIDMIRVNLERWRWIPVNLSPYYILLNIANYEMDIIKNEKEVFTARVIVGKPFRKTPVFSTNMTYIVINPTWTVPPTIFREDILPELRKSTDYLSKKNLKIYDYQNNAIDPSSIDWSMVTPSTFPYFIRQDPGPNNALGDIKFMFPNPYHVYLHDTPNKELFNKSERTFSSGCIRVSKPIELAELLLDDAEKWSSDKINSLIQTRKTTTVFLPEPVKIHLLYWTSWVGTNGKVNFRKDVYQRDKPLLDALNEFK